MTSRSAAINLAAVLAFAVFWIGGVQGYGAKAPWLLAPMVALIGAAGWFHGQKFATWRLDLGHLGRIDAIFVLAFAAALLALTWPRLTQDLWLDAVYNASLATQHAQLAIFHIRAHAPDLWARIADVDVRLVIWGMHAAMLALVILIFVAAPLALGRWPWALALLWVAALVGARTLTSADDGVFAGLASPVLQGVHPEQDPHATLRLAPLWASSALFGPSPLGYRLAGFLAWLGLMLLLFAGLRRTQDIWTSALAVAALATVPVFWHTAYLVEASIWTALAATCLFALLASPHAVRTSLAAPALIVALAAWMRAPAFLALIPLAALVATRLAAGPVPRADLAAAGLGAALAIAGAASAVLGGSPVTSKTPPLAQLAEAFATQTPWIAIVATAGLMPLLFVGAALRLDSTRSALLAAAVVAYLFAAIALFYGPVQPMVWGVSRHQAEIAAPVIAAGILAFALATAAGSLEFRGWTAPPWLRRLAPPSALLAVIVVNVFSLTTFDANVRRTFPHSLPGQNVKSEAEYAIGATFALAGAPAHTYYAGIWYGGFQGVLQGMTSSDYARFSELNERHRAGWTINVPAVLADPDVRAVIVEGEGQVAMSAFHASGWRVRQVSHQRSGLVLYLLTRY